jgi:transposase
VFEGETVYSQSFLQSWGEHRRRCYLHIYFNGQQQQEDSLRFDQYITDLYLELTEGSVVEEHAEAYERFFIVKDTSKCGRKILFDEEALNKARNKYVGFSALLSTKFKDSLDALAVYREKDIIEKCFDDSKNELDKRRLRVHGSKRCMKSRLFIQFIAMILLAAIRKRMRETELTTKYSVTQLLWELESLTTIQYSGRYKNKLSEVTKAQREIFEAF